MSKKMPPPSADDFDIAPQFTSVNDMEEFLLFEAGGATITHVDMPLDSDEILINLSNKKVLRFYNRTCGYNKSGHRYFMYILGKPELPTLPITEALYGDSSMISFGNGDGDEESCLSFMEFYANTADDAPQLVIGIDMDNGSKEDKVAPGIEVIHMN